MRLVYRKLNKYKYLLVDPVRLEIPELSGLSIQQAYYTMNDGWLTIKSGYAWDGASGPAIDTKDFMKGCLIHDVFYQAMREGFLKTDEWKTFADELLYKICVEEGMPKWRAYYVYLAVKVFGPKYKGTYKPDNDVVVID